MTSIILILQICMFTKKKIDSADYIKRPHTSESKFYCLSSVRPMKVFYDSWKICMVKIGGEGMK